MADGKPILSVCCAAHKGAFISITDTVQVCISICCVAGKYSLNDSGGKVKKGHAVEGCFVNIWNKCIWRNM